MTITGVIRWRVAYVLPPYLGRCSSRRLKRQLRSPPPCEWSPGALASWPRFCPFCGVKIEEKTERI